LARRRGIGAIVIALAPRIVCKARDADTLRDAQVPMFSATLAQIAVRLRASWATLPPLQARLRAEVFAHPGYALR